MVIPPGNNDLNSSSASHSRHKVTTTTVPIDNSGANSTADQHPPSSNDVKLSQEAIAIERLESAIHNSPDVNQDKVEYLKQQISQGNYTIDSEAIAEGILR